GLVDEQAQADGDAAVGDVVHGWVLQRTRAAASAARVTMIAVVQPTGARYRARLRGGAMAHSPAAAAAAASGQRMPITRSWGAAPGCAALAAARCAAPTAVAAGMRGGRSRRVRLR